MCGIAGALYFDGRNADRVTLKNMADAIQHRGPDASGVYTHAQLGLSHRRLSIIDLSSAANQPFVSADGRFVLCYNGEVYNFKELKVELEREGFKFRTQSDTEVVLYALVHWGEQALKRFNGMFAFAFFDKTAGELLLARDRYGIKPLYLTLNSDRLLFGSEIKAILAEGSIQSTLDLPALYQYMTFQNLFTCETLFANVNLFPAGHWQKFSIHGGKRSEVTPFWSWRFIEPTHPLSHEEYLEELDRLLTQAVQRQLVADVPIGSYLSGGIDSGTVTCLAAKQLPYLMTFTVGFDLSSASGLELAFDERRKSEMMSYLFKTEHYEMVLKSGDMERCMSDLVWHLEEPRVGQSYPNYYASRLGSRFTKVILSGAGGDELFGGYPWRYHQASSSLTFDEYIDSYYHYWHRLLPNQALRRLFSPVWSNVQHIWTRDIFANIFEGKRPTPQTPTDFINLSLELEAKTFLHGLLVVDDKLSMSHSLETRVPFLDNDLVDFACHLPIQSKLTQLESVKVNENESFKKREVRSRDGKRILRDIMSLYVPSSTQNVEAVKQGFSAPDASWFRGESLDYIQAKIGHRNARIYDFMNYDEASRYINLHLEGHDNRRLLLWSLLYLEEFLARFKL